MMRARIRRWLHHWVSGVAPLLLLAACATGEPPPEHVVPGGDPALGLLAMDKYGCAFCHAIPGVEMLQEIYGPPLNDWTERQYIAGRLPNQAGNLIVWIMDPHAVEPATAMPNLGVSEIEARHMAAYLFTLGRANPPVPSDTFPREHVD